VRQWKSAKSELLCEPEVLYLDDLGAAAGDDAVERDLHCGDVVTSTAGWHEAHAESKADGVELRKMADRAVAARLKSTTCRILVGRRQRVASPVTYQRSTA
jgi:hypothetical protein